MKTDVQLKQDVQAELEWHASVNVTGSTVTLRGMVDSWADRSAAHAPHGRHRAAPA